MDWSSDTERNRRGIGIVRVSSKRQKDNTSLDSQESEIRAYCKQAGLEVVETFAIAESAKNSDDRMAYKKAITFALKSNIRHVLFYMNDREARNLKDIEENEKLILADRIVVHHVHERRVFHKGSPESDFLMRDINGALNKDYIRRLRVKVCRGMQAKAEAGWFPGNTPPLGYWCQREVNEEGRESRRGISRIVIDPNPQRVRLVQREFELRAQGYSIDQIRAKILEEGLILPSSKSKYNRASIEKRLKNKFYWGRFDWQGVEYEGKHPQIIPINILRSVKATFERDYSTRPVNKDAVFGSWLHCADERCGRVIIFDPKKKRNKATGAVKVYHYYHCANSRKIHTTMRNLAVSEESIMEQLAGSVSSISIREEFAQEIADALNATELKAQEAIRSEAAGYRRALKDLEIKEDKAYQDYNAGVLDVSGYLRQVQLIRADRDVFGQRLEQANLAINGAVMKTAKEILELATNATSLWKTAPRSERVEYLKKICSNPVLEGQTVRYDLKKPFLVLAKMKEDKEWW